MPVSWTGSFSSPNIHGKTLRERGEALISIAHSDFRKGLRSDLAARRYFTFG